MTKFVYHGTSRHDWPLIARDGLIPKEPDPDIWPDDWPETDTREPRLFGTNKLSIAKEHVDYPDGVVMRMSDDGQWNVERTSVYRRRLWRTTRVPPDQIKVLLPSGKWCPLSEYERPRPRRVVDAVGWSVWRVPSSVVVFQRLHIQPPMACRAIEKGIAVQVAGDGVHRALTLLIDCNEWIVLRANGLRDGKQAGDGDNN